MRLNQLFLLLYHLSLYITSATSSMKSMNGALKMIEVIIPHHSVSGDSVTLQCNYDLGNNRLYSVKWYKDNEEFYKFVPKLKPQVSSYAVEGVNVDIIKSDSRKVVLDPVTWKSSGVYRCEVSAEAPSFASAQSEGTMEVIVFPEENPVITSTETFYEIGKEITLNCTSGKSYPPSMLYWFINKQQVVNPESLIYYPPIRHHEGLYSTTLGLRFTLESHHFQGGSMTVKCTASPLAAYRNSSKEVMEQNSTDMKEALFLVKSSSTTNLYSMVLSLYFMVTLVLLHTVV